jgi:dipeptidyl aminopeptidase/acylaminoacyl peptidase
MDRLAWLTALALLASGCDMATGPSTAPTGAEASTGPTTFSTPSAGIPSATPAPTDRSVPAGRIAFIRTLDEDGGSEVFVANTDGSAEVQLTTEGAGPGDLVWAPDGSRLYLTLTDRQLCAPTYCYPKRVISIRPDGTGPIDLGGVGAYGVVSVSPDRRYAAFPGGEGYPADGGQSFLIPTQVLDLATGEMTSSSAAGTMWSPDSSRLLGVAFDHISVVDVRSDEQLVRIDDPWAAADGDLGWSPDGGSIYYHRCDPEANKLEAMSCLAGPSWVVNLADPALVPQPNVGAEPAKGVLSPDGAWIASLSDGDAPAGLYLTPAAGGTPRLAARLNLDGGSFEHQPSWSPDSEWLAVGVTGGIQLVAAGGGRPVAMTRGAAPAWQPLDAG